MWPSVHFWSEGLDFINLYTDLDTPVLLSSLPLWVEERGDQYRKHQWVVKHIKEDGEASVEFLGKVLDFKEPSKITKEHIELCERMFEERITMPLPVPHTEYVQAFTDLAGRESYDSKIIVGGCYIIKGSDLIDCYVGQSTHLGRRVKSHAKKLDSTTRFFVES